MRILYLPITHNCQYVLCYLFGVDCAQDGCWGLLETRPRDKLEARNVEQIGVMDPEPRSAVGSR